MNSKILINVYLVKIDQCYDIYIPLSKKMGEVVELVCKTISSLSDIILNYNEGFCVMDSITGQFYDIYKSVNDLNIGNGHKILVF